MKKTIIRELLDSLKMIAFVLVFVFIINNFVIVNALIPSESMEKTIMTGDRIFGNRLSYKFGTPQSGDIVIFRYPDNEEELFIKRIIGVPGDTINIIAGKVYINSSETPLDEPYLSEAMLGDYGPYEVPANSYFMLGDNRNHSRDSRLWTNTYVHEDKILGKAVFRYFPFNNMGAID